MTPRAETAVVRAMVFAALVFSALAMYRTMYSSTDRAQQKAFVEFTQFADAITLIGDSSAAQTLYLVTDHQCPYCQALHDSLAVIMHRDATRLRIRSVPFPLTNIHPRSDFGELALLCVGKRGNATKADSALYALNDTVASLDIDALRTRIGVLSAPAAFKACVESPNTRATLEKAQRLAAELDVTSTPTFWIGQRRFTGVVPIDSIVNALAK